MRYIFLLLLPILALYLQSTLFQNLQVAGNLPDVILIFTIFFALFNGSLRGGVYGVGCGLLEDLYLGRIIGLNTLAKGLVGYILGKAQPHINPESPWIGTLGVLVGSLFHCLIFYAFIWILDLYTVDIYGNSLLIWKNFLIQTAYQTMLAIPLYLWYYHSHTYGWMKPAEEEDRLWNRMNRLVK